MCRVLLILKVDADAIHCFLSTLYHIDSESLLPDSESLCREGCTIIPVVSMLTFPLISDAAALRPVFLYCRLTRSRRSLSVNKHGPSIASTYSLKKTQIICCIFFHTHLLSSVFLEYYLWNNGGIFSGVALTPPPPPPISIVRDCSITGPLQCWNGDTAFQDACTLNPSLWINFNIASCSL